jgi:hypothetical protein
MEYREPKQSKRTDKVYFKPVLIYNAERWTVTKRNKSETQPMDLREKQDGIVL